jgi:hypothetical protein
LAIWKLELQALDMTIGVGETADVHGLVVQISFFKGNAFVNFGASYPRQIFIGFVPAKSVAAAGGEPFLRSLTGNAVTITGRIELYNGRPEIVVSEAAQIMQ